MSTDWRRAIETQREEKDQYFGGDPHSPIPPDEREYLRWGEFRFTVDGEDVALQAYKGDPDDERLWVPFRDATSGDETYGTGRYLDLEDDAHRTNDGYWILDFNEGYNPACAYSDRYECPLPPTANWLEVPIEAGEKAYH